MKGKKNLYLIVLGKNMLKIVMKLKLEPNKSLQLCFCKPRAPCWYRWFTTSERSPCPCLTKWPEEVIKLIITSRNKTRSLRYIKPGGNNL